MICHGGRARTGPRPQPPALLDGVVQGAGGRQMVRQMRVRVEIRTALQCFPLRPVLGQRPPGPVAAVPERYGERAGRHSLCRHRGERVLFVRSLLLWQRPQVGAPAGGAPVEAGQLGLQLDDPEHERGRAPGDRRIPGLFEPAEQDLRLGLHRRRQACLIARTHPATAGRSSSSCPVWRAEPSA